MNTGDMIAKYIAIRDYVAARTKEHEAELEPYVSGMKAIENHCAELLNQMEPSGEGKANIALPEGTVFRKREMAVKVANRETFFKFIADDFWARCSFLTGAVTKTEVADYIAANNALPPGLDVTYFLKTQFRKPT